jgi:hypothetical protein
MDGHKPTLRETAANISPAANILPYISVYILK